MSNNKIYLCMNVNKKGFMKNIALIYIQRINNGTSKIKINMRERDKGVK